MTLRSSEAMVVLMRRTYPFWASRTQRVIAALVVAAAVAGCGSSASTSSTAAQAPVSTTPGTDTFDAALVSTTPAQTASTPAKNPSTGKSSTGKSSTGKLVQGGLRHDHDRAEHLAGPGALERRGTGELHSSSTDHGGHDAGPDHPDAGHHHHQGAHDDQA